MTYKPERKPKPKVNTGRPLDLKAKQTLQKQRDWKVR